MAFNIHEEYWDRPLSGNSQDNRIPHGIAVFLSGLFSLLCKVLFRFRVEGKEIVDAFAGKTTGAILVSPHYSYLDVIIMFLSVRPKGWVRLIVRAKDSWAWLSRASALSLSSEVALIERL